MYGGISIGFKRLFNNVFQLIKLIIEKIIIENIIYFFRIILLGKVINMFDVTTNGANNDFIKANPP